MAPKRPTPLEDPPAASSEEEESSSSGEDEEDGEEEEGSSSEDEQPQGKPQKKSSPPPQQTQTAKAASKKSDLATQRAESESESDAGTESDSDSEDAPKPIASKPMEETPTKTTKPRSKLSVSFQIPAKSTAKRGTEVDRDEKGSKRAKTKDSESDGAAEKSEDTKKLLFQRLWSEDDEIAVLKGVIEFAEKKGVDPAKDMSSFYDFIKKSLHFDVSLSQLKDKVWRLKKKFVNHVSKGKKCEDKTFSKSHDQKAFDLSRKIWGREGVLGAVESSVKSNGKPKKSGDSSNNNNHRGKTLAALKAELGVGVEKEKETEKLDKKEFDMEDHSGLKGTASFDKSVGVAGMEDYVVKRGLDMMEGAKKAEMEEKWRNLHVAELELFLKRNELIMEQAKLILAAYKSQ